MLLKKVIYPFALGMACMTSAYAGAMGENTAPSFQGLYVEGNVGYAFRPWTNDRTTTVGLENQLGVLTKLSNINGGVIGGVDVGYQLTPYIAAEGGWSYLPTASYNRVRTVVMPVAATTFTLPQGLQVNINSGFGYLAFKGTIPIYDSVSAFSKLGAAYVYNRTNVPIPASLVNTPTAYTTNHSNFWNPLLAFGLQYSTLNNWLFNVQYVNVLGYHEASASRFITPSVQTLTFGVGYKFFT